MSITADTLKKHLKDPAIFCCRREKGLVIGAADLEDPSLFDDMVEAGLLELSENGLRIEQVLGSTLMQDVEALTPITRAVLDKVNDVEVEEKKETPVNVLTDQPVAATQIKSALGGNGMIHIEIGKAEKLEGLSLDIPVVADAAGANIAANIPVASTKAVETVGEKKVIRTLIKKHIKITDAEIGTETSIKDGKITIDGSIV